MIEHLLALIPDHYMVGITEFKEPEKKYLCCSYYKSMAEEYGEEFKNDIDSDLLELGNSKSFYGSNVGECIKKCIKYYDGK